jgi:two-component sensor histidine kinase
MFRCLNALLVPLYLGTDDPLGTLWIVSEAEGHFDGRHADALAELAGFAGLALRMASDQQKLKQALDAQQMLTQEMTHRLKKVLAVVNGLVNMASRQGGSATDLAARTTRSLEALSVAQSLVTPQITETSARATTLKAILEAVLAPYTHGTFTLVGPEVEVGPQASSILALVFKELATNAAKYGALTKLGGAVSIDWKRRQSGLHKLVGEKRPTNCRRSHFSRVRHSIGYKEHCGA